MHYYQSFLYYVMENLFFLVTEKIIDYVSVLNFRFLWVIGNFIFNGTD